MNRVTQLDLADALSDIKWHGNYFSAWCPVDAHEKQALAVFEDSCWCFSCQKQFSFEYIYKLATFGDKKAPNIVKRQNDNTRPPWKTWLSEFESWEKFVQQAHETLMTFPFTGEYIFRRGISQTTIQRTKLGIIDNWVVFPCFDAEGMLNDITVRNTAAKFFGVRPHEQHESLSVFVPDWDRINKNNSVLVPFGMFDCLSLYEAGYAALTGISGKQLSASHLQSIQKQFVIIPDYNERDSAIKLIRQLGWKGKLLDIQWAKYDDCKDINDIHLKFGIEEVKKLITI